MKFFAHELGECIHIWLNLLGLIEERETAIGKLEELEGILEG